MKIQEKAARANELRPGQKTATSPEGKKFSKVLEKKKTSSHGDQSPAESEVNGKSKKKMEESPLKMSDMEARFEQTLSNVEAPKSPQSVAAPSPIQSLVQEIVVGINASGQDEVQIQMNSSTLEGLRIHIAKEAGNISIQFVSRSNEVAELLNKNLDSLSQALAAHDINVGQIQVRSSAEPSRFEDRGRQGGDRHQGESGQQRRRR